MQIFLFSIPFTISYLGLTFSFLFLIAAFYLLKRKGPALKVPSLMSFQIDKQISLSRFLPLTALTLLLLSLALSLFDPFYVKELNEYSHSLPSKGRAWTLLIDRSSSMGRSMLLPNGEIDSLLHYSTHLFWEGIKNRQDDLVSIIAFDRVPDILLPLTPDKQSIFETLENIRPTSLGNQNNATAITYALYKAIYLAEGAEKKGGAFQADRKILVLLTDGLEKVPEEDLKDPLRGIAFKDMMEKAKEAGVRVYILSLFPSIQQPQFGPERRRMELLAKGTNGGFFPASPDGLKEAFQKIDDLEEGNASFNPPAREEGLSLAPYFALASMIFLVIYLLFREVVYLSLP